MAEAALLVLHSAGDAAGLRLGPGGGGRDGRQRALKGRRRGEGRHGKIQISEFKTGAQYLNIEINYGSDLEAVDVMGGNALSRAAAAGRADMVRQPISRRNSEVHIFGEISDGHHIGRRSELHYLLCGIGVEELVSASPRGPCIGPGNPS
jgi:hypothetical protein